MKKAKIMLSAILVLAIVGGVFAFKAPKKAAVCFLTTATNAPGDPSLPATCAPAINFTTAAATGVPTTLAFTKTLSDVDLEECVDITTTCARATTTIYDSE